MLEEIRIYNSALTSNILLNELTGPLRYPVRVFTWSHSTKGDPLPKLQDSGQHDRYSYIDSMSITMEGDILGLDTDDYWVNRKALLNIVIPKPDQTHRFHSQIRIRLDGDPATYYANVVLEDYDVPLEAFYPTRTPFIFQWTCPFGYWRNLSTNQVAFI